MNTLSIVPMETEAERNERLMKRAQVQALSSDSIYERQVAVHDVSRDANNRRSSAAAVMRETIDELQSVCNNLRANYPDRYPIPPEVDEIFNLEELVLAKARDGRLRSASM